jgi:hypothetical protein
MSSLNQLVKDIESLGVNLNHINIPRQIEKETT